MSLLGDYFHDLRRSTAAGWNQFWFTPADAATLSLIRILTGCLLLYTHLVWSLDLTGFFGSRGWMSADAVHDFYNGGHAWSHFWISDSPAFVWSVHLAALAVFACLTGGLWSRPASVLAYLVTVSYANRVPAATFGLDQINALLAMYLMFGRSGDAYSIDRWRSRRANPGSAQIAAPAVSTNIAIRLIQLHMCVIYAFAGASKLQGPTWWGGSALWFAFGNSEYQTLDLTWLAGYPILVNALTHVTVLWELTFSALIWPRLTRPIVLTLAVVLHLGIGVCLGMMTFGFAMLVGCAAFIPPALVRRVLSRAEPMPKQRAAR